MSRLLWTQKQDVGPAPRFAHAMVFDQSSQRVLLFGGNALNQLFKDTWQWDGQDWTQLEDTGPSARSGHAMAYDVARNRTVLFGGASSTGDLGDTWEWDGTAWTQIQDVGPSPRVGHAMAFDGARGRVILFGGGAADGTPQGDTWVWDGQDWTQVEDTGPSARRGHAMTYDSARSRTVLFGGVGAAVPNGLADTWEWDGTVWKKVADIGPEGCVGAAFVFRTSISVLFGGLSTTAPVTGQTLFGLTWEWDGKHWTDRQDIGVGARYRHAMAFDSARQRVVLFGGVSVPEEEQNAATKLKGDTWEHADVAAGTGGGAGAGTGTGTGDGTGPVPIKAVSVAPYHPGEPLTITVELVAPAPPGGNEVVITAQAVIAVNLASIMVPASATSTTASVSLPMGGGGLVAQSFTVTARSGGVTRSTTVIVLSS